MPSLLLHPADQAWCPDSVDGFVKDLQQLGFIGDKPIPDDLPSYQVGAKFLQLLIFLGCSPRINIDPADAGTAQELCFVRLQSFDDVVFHSSDPHPKVRCRHCRTPAHVEESTTFDAVWKCEHCGVASRVAMLDWRQAAGYSRFFLEVSAVYPHEAVPSEKLLAELSILAGCDWAYFFCNKQSCTN